MDLSPRHAAEGNDLETVPPAPRVRDRRKIVSIGVLVAVLAVGGVVVTKFLTSSLDYYCNVDEVGRKDGCEVGRRLRIQGSVDEGTLKSTDGVTEFTMSFGGVTVPVVYDGQPGGAFQECIPVVVHGVMQDTGVFDGDEVEVKHTNEYEEKNQDRIDQSESQACAAAAPAASP